MAGKERLNAVTQDLDRILGELDVLAEAHAAAKRENYKGKLADLLRKEICLLDELSVASELQRVLLAERSARRARAKITGCQAMADPAHREGGMPMPKQSLELEGYVVLEPQPPEASHLHCPAAATLPDTKVPAKQRLKAVTQDIDRILDEFNVLAEAHAAAKREKYKGKGKLADLLRKKICLLDELSVASELQSVLLAERRARHAQAKITGCQTVPLAAHKGGGTDMPMPLTLPSPVLAGHVAVQPQPLEAGHLHTPAAAIVTEAKVTESYSGVAARAQLWWQRLFNGYQHLHEN